MTFSVFHRDGQRRFLGRRCTPLGVPKMNWLEKSRHFGHLITHVVVIVRRTGQSRRRGDCSSSQLKMTWLQN
jgi:hypothetical protein